MRRQCKRGHRERENWEVFVLKMAVFRAIERLDRKRPHGGRAIHLEVDERVALRHDGDVQGRCQGSNQQRPGEVPK